MNRRALSTMIGLVGLTVGLMAQTGWADTYEVVVKYGGKLVKQANGTGLHEVFGGKSMATGQDLILAIPNGDESKPAYTPNATIEAMIKGFNVGDLLDIVATPSKIPSGAPLVQSAKVYTPLAGEDDPHGFVYVETFDHKTGHQDVNFISLTRFKQKVTLVVPTHRDDSGDMVPDDVTMGIINHLQAGEVVYATFARGNTPTLKTLAPFKNRFTGKFVKLDPSVEVDANKDHGPAVVLTDADGKKVTALVPGVMQGKRWVPDSIIMGMARPIAAMALRLKSDVDVDYITADSGDNRIWLVSISETPKTPAKPQVSHNNS
jgi:hypothetical protein